MEVKGSEGWGRKGEECAAGGNKCFESEYFAVLAIACLMFTNSALSSFAVTYWPVKRVFFLALLVPRLASKG